MTDKELKLEEVEASHLTRKLKTLTLGGRTPRLDCAILIYSRSVPRPIIRTAHKPSWSNHVSRNSFERLLLQLITESF
jgi:hypothetical protein